MHCQIKDSFTRQRCS